MLRGAGVHEPGSGSGALVIRVVYRWRVDPHQFAAFRDSWRATTNRIHETVPGARGSFLLRAADDESEVLTVATWDSLEAWRRFWGESDPEQMSDMGRFGTRVSAVAYENVEDHTR